MNRFNLSLISRPFNLKQIEVIGLYIGARGTISTFFQNFIKKFELSPTIIDDNLLFALRGSIQIYNYHVRMGHTLLRSVPTTYSKWWSSSGGQTATGHGDHHF